MTTQDLKEMARLCKGGIISVAMTVRLKRNRLDSHSPVWTQCDNYYNCGGCCDAGRDLLNR